MTSRFRKLIQQELPARLTFSIFWRQRIVALVLNLLICAACLAQNQPASPAAASPAPQSAEEKSLFALLNASRTQAGLSTLRWDSNLAAAARQHCAAMVQHDALSHQFPGEPGLEQRLKNAGVAFTAAAENVAVGASPEQIQAEWMHSSAHRENILDPQLNAVGVAAMPGRQGIYAVQDFALSPEKSAAEKLSIDQQEEKIRGLIAATGVRVSDDADHSRLNDARRACPTNDAYPDEPFSIMRIEGSDLSELPAQLRSLLRSGRFKSAAVGACPPASGGGGGPRYRIAVLLYPTP